MRQRHGTVRRRRVLRGFFGIVHVFQVSCGARCPRRGHRHGPRALHALVPLRRLRLPLRARRSSRWKAKAALHLLPRPGRKHSVGQFCQVLGRGSARVPGKVKDAQDCNSITHASLLSARWDVGMLAPSFLHLFLGPACKLWKLAEGELRCEVDGLSAAVCERLEDVRKVNEYMAGLDDDVKCVKQDIADKAAVSRVFTAKQRALLVGDGRGGGSVAALNVSQQTAWETFGVAAAD
mmetsp:Transcript_1299/g.4002  ORF Transcript_1299/g.4002 Transcript_1299/m.4002 type:complete len:236 (+) Transcript_1299:1910-2617(+)